MPAGFHQRPAFSGRQRDDPVDVGSFVLIDLPRQARDLFAVSAARPDPEHLLDIASLEDLGLGRPGMIVRIGIRFAHPEAMQHTAVVEKVFSERPRHPLYPDDGSSGGHAVSDGTR